MNVNINLRNLVFKIIHLLQILFIEREINSKQLIKLNIKLNVKLKEFLWIVSKGSFILNDIALDFNCVFYLQNPTPNILFLPFITENYIFARFKVFYWIFIIKFCMDSPIFQWKEIYFGNIGLCVFLKTLFEFQNFFGRLNFKTQLHRRFVWVSINEKKTQLTLRFVRYRHWKGHIRVKSNRYFITIRANKSTFELANH